MTSEGKSERERLEGIMKAPRMLLLRAMMSSCTCGVKSPDPLWHDGGCCFRTLSELSDALDIAADAILSDPAYARAGSLPINEQASALATQAHAIGYAAGERATLAALQAELEEARGLIEKIAEAPLPGEQNSEAAVAYVRAAHATMGIDSTDVARARALLARSRP